MIHRNSWRNKYDPELRSVFPGLLLPLISPSSGSPCLDLVLGLRHSPPYRRRRAVETPVLRGLLPQPSLDRRTEDVIEFRTCASTTRCFTCGTFTQQGDNIARGQGAVKIIRLHQPHLRERFPRNGLHPEVCFRKSLHYSNTTR